MAISTRAMLELLRRMGCPQGPAANLTKPRMAALITGALVPHEGWATAVLGNVRLASSNRDSADLSTLAFGLELSMEPPVHLFFPAGGVVPAAVAGNGPENEVAPPNAEAAATERPLDLVAILATMQQGFAWQDVASARQDAASARQDTSLRNLEATVDCRLRDQEKEFSQHIESVRREMATEFQQRLDAVGLDFRKEVGSLQQRLQQVEHQQTGATSTAATPMLTSDDGMSTSGSSMSASKSDLSLAAQLAAANPARQNPKLISQALSATPPALKLF